MLFALLYWLYPYGHCHFGRFDSLAATLVTTPFSAASWQRGDSLSRWPKQCCLKGLFKARITRTNGQLPCNFLILLESTVRALVTNRAFLQPGPFMVGWAATKWAWRRNLKNCPAVYTLRPVIRADAWPGSADLVPDVRSLLPVQAICKTTKAETSWTYVRLLQSPMIGSTHPMLGILWDECMSVGNRLLQSFEIC